MKTKNLAYFSQQSEPICDPQILPRLLVMTILCFVTFGIQWHLLMFPNCIQVLKSVFGSLLTVADWANVFLFSP